MSFDAASFRPQHFLWAFEAGVATITLNRPERKNPLTFESYAELRDTFRALTEARDVKAVVITGAGGNFCSGGDVHEIIGPLTRMDMPGLLEFTRMTGDLVKAMRACPQPIVAAINGPCAGIGLVLALMCDIRFAAEGAKLTTAFARRGLVAEHGISWMLPRLIGPMNALDLLMSARTVTAEEAATLGLVRVLPADGFAEAVQARASEIANLSSPRSTRIIKRQVYEALFQSLAEATAIANREQEICRDTEDFREGVAHYVEKRPPNFTGR